MRRWGMLAALVLAVGTGSTSAAIVGPDSFGYRANNDVPYAFVDIRGSGKRTLAGLGGATWRYRRRRSAG